MPERIGAYRLESPLGHGGMGEVFLAWDERLERLVAIKRIRHDTFAPGQHRERFRREARLAARLSHASIVQVHDLVMEESGDAIVMEYIEGPTLAERLTRGPLGTAEAVRLAREIAEGLAAAHEAGLIHRDLKAENIVVTPSGHAKILDFGLARLVSWDGEMLTQQNALIGTCYAMSPEQARGGELDGRSDLFSFGALLYEMLTGRSAFRAKNPVATLERVLHGQPAPLAQVLPDLPEDLVALVERLLLKDRDGRPTSAARVARKLERIERELPAEEMTRPNDDSVSEMPTQAFAALPFKRSASAMASPVRRARGWKPVLAGALGAVVIAMAAFHFLPQRPAAASPTLRVLVMRPEISGTSDERLALVASGVLASSLSSLTNLQRISVVDPTTVPSSLSVQETVRIGAADEVLISGVQKNASVARVNLRRVDSGGSVLWSDTFDVPTDAAGLRLLNDKIDQRLQHAFESFPPRSGRTSIAASDLDYSEYLEIRQRIDAGSLDLKPDLKQLELITQRSPQLLEAQVMAAELAYSLFQSTREAADLERARAHVRQAQRLAPDDPRTLKAQFKVALAAQQWNEADRTLKQIELALPGDPETLLLRYQFADSQGHVKEAEKVLQQAVERSPSWRNISWLAKFELDHGKVPEARSHLEKLLDQTPGNTWVMEQLAYLELLYGDLERAERIYEALARSKPQRSYFTSLGQARSLRRHYPEAADAYNQALEFDSGHIIVTLNLADTELDLGDKTSARALYGSVLKRLEDNQIGSRLPPKEEMMRAQCLARLGRAAEAREAAQHALARASNDAERLYEAAVVYGVLGDESEVLTYMEAALKHGLSRYWFEGSTAFYPMRQNAKFRALLESDRSEQGH